MIQEMLAVAVAVLGGLAIINIGHLGLRMDRPAMSRAMAAHIDRERFGYQDDCGECEGGGHVYSSYQAAGAPNFTTCPECHNPRGLPCP
jgi:hypothetical protein